MKNKRQGFMKKVVSLTIAVVLAVGIVPGKKVNAATNTDEFRQEIIEMLETGDMSVHNIRQYNMKYSEYNAICKSVLENEGKIASQCFGYMCFQSSKDGLYMKECWLYATASNVAERYQKTLEVIEDVRSQLTKMSDLEKALYVHDYIVKNTSYQNDSEKTAHCAGGVLADGAGVCDGYAKALNLILELEGIESQVITNDTGSHGWSAIKIDGEWYNIDPTWDDTRSAISGEISHNFFLRNDDEFKNAATNKHSNWTGSVSSSEKYENWYVHDIVGDMYYWDGEWYYEKDGSIVKNSIEGTNETAIMVIENEDAEIESLVDGVLCYTNNNGKYTVDLAKKIEEVPMETPSATPTEAPSATPTEAPSAIPTESPSATPTEAPSATPTEAPSATPTEAPSATPTESPSATPTEAPSAIPTEAPSATPTEAPSATPTEAPSETPTEAPSATPTEAPSATPTEAPSATPTEAPSETPTEAPSATPTEAPSETPTESPSATPTEAPSETPTEAPSATPTEAPSATPTEAPSETPTEAPSATPTEAPSATPTEAPSATPTEAPTVTPTEAPSAIPTEAPSATPSVVPTTTPDGVGKMDKDYIEKKMKNCKKHFLAKSKQKKFNTIIKIEVKKENVKNETLRGKKYKKMVHLQHKISKRGNSKNKISSKK